MLQKYFILLFIFQFLIEINCQTFPSIDKERSEHTATLIDKKLYILGGLSTNNVGKDFFYFDFSVPFNTQNLLIKDLSSINTIPSHFGAGSARGGAINDTLFIIENAGAIKLSSVHTFNPQNNSWNTPVTTGVIPILYDASIGTIDHDGKMYFWDGIGDIIAILDTKNLIWETRSSIGAPNIGLKSATTLLPNNKIIYIDSSASSLIKVYIYDIINDTWSTKITSGTMPPNKLGASAVLGLDGQRVIIYGGSSNAKPVDSSLYELNLINYEWRIPKTSGKTPASRTSHRANVIGKYMVVSFGLGYNESEENDILLLDISNKDEYIWTNEYDPTSSNISAQSFNEPSKVNVNITGAIVGSLIVCALFVFALYMWNKRSQAEKNIFNHGQGIVASPDNGNIHNYELESSNNVNIHNHGREFVESSNNENMHNHGQEIVEPPSNERIFNHGREIV
ncbi:uncharacterized protein OCT59_011308 [Rhizophagus irregularis]|uniref:Kel1p n=2 Tax=Rhizophagus irregularis TaxID=588596 RepID=A0A015JT80_RHIIW|nr:hypothetical protein GLOIN_2v1843891 [Rhizophagus irregularis DAOM 181602=DAOM 197198]EXX72792.1 Kel1p [Rhizophagus irregularis DAOM 197198w]POG66917.1 hypothetical protein GLOIN_2v1843891 [Rhizophagus irregularis DAOM 181602=DAOM 197198]UZO20047.1 hypothetical protein OCT59_011308 [Rhizophagus irregularis]|eukprot:XP_025173783.1 hypothetical protein GLOIN_2v1843891 [Rhizophagus irregularis DAOM 181602=DAOM 197198]